MSSTVVRCSERLLEIWVKRGFLYILLSHLVCVSRCESELLENLQKVLVLACLGKCLREICFTQNSSSSHHKAAGDLLVYKDHKCVRHWTAESFHLEDGETCILGCGFGVFFCCLSMLAPGISSNTSILRAKEIRNNSNKTWE